jgi:hypothetical protein
VKPGKEYETKAIKMGNNMLAALPPAFNVVIREGLPFPTELCSGSEEGSYLRVTEKLVYSHNEGWWQNCVQWFRGSGSDECSYLRVAERIVYSHNEGWWHSLRGGFGVNTGLSDAKKVTSRKPGS